MSDTKKMNDTIVKLIFAVDEMNKLKKSPTPRYACGKLECQCQTCKNSKEWGEFGKLPANDSCWCHRDRSNDKEYYDDITPCKKGGFKECLYYIQIEGEC